MKLFPRLLTLGGATAIVVCLLRPPAASADITIESTFAGVAATVTVRDDGLDTNPATDSDHPIPDETWRTSYSSSVSAQASKNGGAGSGTGNLAAQLSVNGNRLSYSTSGSAQCNFTSSDTFTGTFFSAASAAGDATIRFTLTERSNFSIMGAISIFNPGSAQVRLSGNGVNKDFVVENRVNIPGAKSLNISDGGVLEPGSYTLVLRVRPSTPQPFSSSTASGNFRFEIGSPPTEDIRWINTAGGTFGTSENWNPSKVPTGNSTAIFDPAAAYTVNVGTAASDRLVIQNGDVTFTNVAYSVTSIEFDPASVVLDNAKLTLASGQLNSGHALIGLSGASRLDVNTDAKWTSTGSIRVGGAGNGILAITDDAKVTSAESQIGSSVAGGSVFLRNGAQWTTGNLAVGFSGAGTLTATDGLIRSINGSVGFNAGATGTVILEDETIWALDGSLVVGVKGLGTVTVMSGASLQLETLTVGGQIGGTGSVTVSGVSAEPDGFATSLYVFGETTVNGTLLLEKGGFSQHLDISDQTRQPVIIGATSDGSLTIRGTDPVSGKQSQMRDISVLTVGEAKRGTLLVEDGAFVQNVRSASLGAKSGAVGDVTVQNDGIWNVDTTLVVGRFGRGNLTVKDGSVVAASVLTIGDQINSIGSAVVTGADTSLQIFGPLFVGEAGRGRLIVAAGAKVFVGALSPANLVMGGQETFTSEVTIGGKDPNDSAGPGAVISVNGNLVMGSQAVSVDKLNVTEDGTLSCVDATLGAIEHSFGEVRLGTVDGSGVVAQFNVSGDLTVGEVGNGLLLLRSGAGVTVGGTIFVGDHGALAGNGTLSAATRILSDGGFISPGLSPGTLIFESDFEQTTTSTLRMEVAGLEPGQFDVLHVTGNATLGGTLEVTFLDGYLPKTGDAIPFLQVDGAVSGDFAQITFPQLAPGFQIKTEMVAGKYQVTALNNAVRLFARESFRGLLSGDPAGHAAAGFFKIHTTPRGGFSARFVLGGRIVTLGGKFNSGGTFSKTILRKSGSPLTVNLELAVIDGARVITGTITDGAQSIDLSADRANAFNAKNNPAPQAGKYTVLLPFDPAAIDTPQANGIGTMTIRKSGAVRFAGALADGKRLSQGTAISKSGEWPLYVLLYKKRGALFGTLQFQDKTGSDFDGTLHWSRPQTLGNRIQTSGFLAALPAIGSRYAAPPARPAILDLPNGATATLSDADLTPALTKGLTLNSRNKFAVSDAGADKLLFSATTASGLLSARFIHPTTGLEITVQGVLFQKRNLGSGFFLRRGQIGSLNIQANP